MPRGENDDWYWIYASVLQRNATNNDGGQGEDRQWSTNGNSEEKQSESQGNSQREGQSKLGSMMVVTNDQMRDHWLDMVDPGAFARW